MTPEQRNKRIEELSTWIWMHADEEPHHYCDCGDCDRHITELARLREQERKGELEQKK